MTRAVATQREDESLEVSPGPRPNTVRTASGEVVAIPEGWAHLAPGDALLTRRVKAGGPSWTVSELVRNKRMSRGVWAPAERIEAAKRSVTSTRAAPEYTRQLEAGRARRARAEADYVREFGRQVEAFLAFHGSHAALARTLAERVAEHATPVGSGTVARTRRIPVERRAEAAVIAWLRHQTTAYDAMHIPRVAGARHEVRRMLAERSRALLDRYRRGLPSEPGCPLVAALAGAPKPDLRTRAADAREDEADPFEDDGDDSEAGDVSDACARDEADDGALVQDAVRIAEARAAAGDPELAAISEAEAEAARRAARQAIVRKKLARR